MPALGQTSYRYEAETLSGYFHEVGYRTPAMDRTDSYRKAQLIAVDVVDRSSHQIHTFSVLTHIHSIKKAWAIWPRPSRYWEGSRWAQRLGACSHAGESGTLWRRPASGYIAERELCLTEDGVILESAAAGRMTFVVTGVKREAIGPSNFDLSRIAASTIRVGSARQADQTK